MNKQETKIKVLSKIILTNADKVIPHIFQYLIDEGKTVELWDWDKTADEPRRRIKRWIKSRHILWMFPANPNADPELVL